MITSFPWASLEFREGIVVPGKFGTLRVFSLKVCTYMTPELILLVDLYQEQLLRWSLSIARANYC